MILQKRKIFELEYLISNFSFSQQKKNVLLLFLESPKNEKINKNTSI